MGETLSVGVLYIIDVEKNHGSFYYVFHINPLVLYYLFRIICEE